MSMYLEWEKLLPQKISKYLPKAIPRTALKVVNGRFQYRVITIPTKSSEDTKKYIVDAFRKGFEAGANTVRGFVDNLDAPDLKLEAPDLKKEE
jgi:hypothetical protein